MWGGGPAPARDFEERGGDPIRWDTLWEAHAASGLSIGDRMARAVGSPPSTQLLCPVVSSDLCGRENGPVRPLFTQQRVVLMREPEECMGTAGSNKGDTCVPTELPGLRLSPLGGSTHIHTCLHTRVQTPWDPAVPTGTPPLAVDTAGDPAPALTTADPRASRGQDCRSPSVVTASSLPGPTCFCRQNRRSG